MARQQQQQRPPRGGGTNASRRSSCSTGHFLLLLLLLLAAAPCPVAAYYCLDYWRPVGTALYDAPLRSRSHQPTTGELARLCNSFCDAEPSCTAAFSAGAVTTGGARCTLLNHTAADVAAALVPAPGLTYPVRQPAFTARNGSEEKSLSWLCFKSVAAWDELGAATHAAVLRTAAGANSSSSSSAGTPPGWCVYATDVAGINLDDKPSGGANLAACAAHCERSSECGFWIGRPGHCWLKYSPLVGADGWTAAYRAAWLDQSVQPNAAAACFKNKEDFRELGAQLSPSTSYLHFKDTYYVLFPERVNFTEAQGACARNLPGGTLALLDTREKLVAVGNGLLPTLPMQYSLQVAWVGARGLADPHHTAAIIAGDSSMAPPGEDAHLTPAQLAAEGGPRWLATGQLVNASLFTHPGERYLQWRGADASFSRYVPQMGKPVCAAVLGVSPPSAVSSIALPSVPLIDNATRPGLYVFTCRRPTAFICQSASLPPLLARQTRVMPEATKLLLDIVQVSRDGAGGRSAQQLALAISLPVVAVLLLLLLLSLLCCRHLRSFTRVLAMQRKRALGMPRRGCVTVVATDIQGFTSLMERHPVDMGKALLLHNQLVQGAVWANAGRVLVTEGDSFIVGFREPLDAAAFALQLQLGLMRLALPPTIAYEDEDQQQQQHDAPSGLISADSSNHYSSTPEPLLDGADSGPHPQQQQPSSRPTPSASPFGRTSSPDSTLEGGSFDSGIGGGGGAAGAQVQGSRSAFVDALLRLRLQVRRSGSSRSLAGSPGVALQGSRSMASNGSGPQHHQQQQQQLPGAGPGSVQLATSPSSTSKAVQRTASRRLSARLSAVGSRWWRQLLAPHHGLSEASLFRGLRVRIGMATGPITGRSVESSPAYSLARVICDAGNGGQILLCAATFTAIVEELQLLGAVTADGVDFKQLAARPTGRAARSSGTGGNNRQRTESRGVASAQVLDMGLWEVPMARVASTATALSSDVVDLAEASTRSWRGREGSLQQQPLAPPCQQLQQQQQQHHVVHFQLDQSRQGERSASRSQELHDLQASAFAHAALQLAHSGSLTASQRRAISTTSFSLQASRAASKLGGDASRTSLERPGSLSDQQQQQQHLGGGLVRMYQLLAPELVGRAVFFGNCLHLDDGWRCLDAPFFAAPGLCCCAADDPRQQTRDAARAAFERVGVAAEPEGLQQLLEHEVMLAAAAAEPSASSLGQVGGGSCSLSCVRASGASGLAAAQAAAAGPSSLAVLRAMSLQCAWPGAAGSTSLAAAPPGGKQLGPAASPPAYPPVTAVFMAVEGAERLQAQQPGALRLVMMLLHKLLLEALCVLPGGYLVRVQEGEGRFLLVFGDAPTALQCCLLVQEAALALPYPDAVLRAARCLRTEHDAASGRLLFRGPRLRMGAAKGVPTCILPDCRGRADYFSASVNQAARFADAAAHGGQLVVDAALARRVLERWQQQAASAAPPRDAAAAAGDDGAPAGPGLATSAAPWNWQPAEVAVAHLGSWLFKGCAKSMAMCSVALTSLAGRRFPAEPPRGKGVRLAPKAGMLGVATVPLPSAAGLLQSAGGRGWING